MVFPFRMAAPVGGRVNAPALEASRWRRLTGGGACQHAVDSAFHIRQLLCDLAVHHTKYVHASDVAGLTVSRPMVPPANDTAVPGSENLFGLEPSLRRAREELLPELAYARLTLESLAIRRRPGAVEHAIIGHELHDRVDVVVIEHVVEALDD